MKAYVAHLVGRAGDFVGFGDTLVNELGEVEDAPTVCHVQSE